MCWIRFCLISCTLDNESTEAKEVVTILENPVRSDFIKGSYR